jgi:hypothetical protein
MLNSSVTSQEIQQTISHPLAYRKKHMEIKEKTDPKMSSQRRLRSKLVATAETPKINMSEKAIHIRIVILEG